MFGKHVRQSTHNARSENVQGVGREHVLSRDDRNITSVLIKDIYRGEDDEPLV